MGYYEPPRRGPKPSATDYVYVALIFIALVMLLGVFVS